jgi:hypothetical protein
MRKLTAGDNAQAEALRIAWELLRSLGWKFTAQDAGKTAAQILNAMSLATTAEGDGND